MGQTLIQQQQGLGSSDASVRQVFVVGTSTDVTNGRATHTLATLIAALPVPSGSTIIFLAETFTLTANLTLASSNLTILGESEAAQINTSTFLFTLSGANCFLAMNFPAVAPGSVVLGGSGHKVIALQTFHAAFSITGSGISVEAVSNPNGLILGATDGLVGWAKRSNTLSASPLEATAWNGSVFALVGDSDGTNAVTATSTTGATWTKRANTLGSFTLRSVAWNGSVFCAVGESDGTNSLIATSPDGITWTKQTNTLGNFALRSVTWNGSVFCAVGVSDGTNSLIATSPTGVTWTKQTNTLGNFQLNSVTWNGSVFCAVGVSDGTNSLIATSPTGVTWTKQTNTLGNFALNGVTWNGSVFCAVGASDGANATIATSPTGVTWTKRANMLGNFLLRAATWNGSIFVAVGQSDGVNPLVATSPDGINWTKQANGLGAGGPSLLGVTWNGAIFVAVGQSDGTNGLIATSTEGGPSVLSLTNKARLYGVRLYTGGLSPGDAVLRTAMAAQVEAQPFGLNPTDLIYLRGPYCKRGNQTAPTFNGTPQQLLMDGITWTKQANTLGNFALNGVAWNGSVFCVVGNSDGTNSLIATSPTGVTWTKQTNTLGNFALNAVASNGIIFVAVGNSDGTNAIIATSPTGTTWTKQANTLGNFALRGVVWAPALGLFVAVGASDGTNAIIATSPDGVTWTKRTNTLGNFQLNAVTWSPSLGLLCAVSALNVTTLIATSPDGVTWTSRTNPSTHTLNCIAWNGSVFVTAGNLGFTFYSPDGINWTAGTLLTTQVNGIAWNGVVFCAVGNSTGTQPLMFTSPNGIIWSGPLNGLGAFALNAITSNGALFVAAGASDGTNVIIATSPDGGVGPIDTNLNWDGVNHRFTPTVPGLYRAKLVLRFTTTVASSTYIAQVRKNGVMTAEGVDSIGATIDPTALTIDAEDFIDCNGSTDYIDFALSATAASALGTALTDTYCLIQRLAP